MGRGGFSANPESINYISLVIFAVALFILQKWKPNPVFVMIASGVAGGAIYLLI